MAKKQDLSVRPKMHFVPLPEVPEGRNYGHRGPISMALEEAYKKKQALVIELNGRPLAAYVSSQGHLFKKQGLRLRSRSHEGKGYVWLEKREK